jgi:hypothetical protein
MNWAFFAVGVLVGIIAAFVIAYQIGKDEYDNAHRWE